MGSMQHAYLDMATVAGMSELEDDVVALMRKRVYDVCGVLGKTVKVTPWLLPHSPGSTSARRACVQAPDLLDSP